MAIITRVVFHYIAYLFILFRINRAQQFNDIQKRLIDPNSFLEGADAAFKEKFKSTSESSQMDTNSQLTGSRSKKKVIQKA